jgi:chromosome segregation ATPase
MREYTKRQEDIITAIMREKNQVREQAQKEIDEIKRRNERQEGLILNLNKEKEELKASQEKFRVNLDREIKEQAQKEIEALKNEINNEKKAQNELKEQLEQLTEEHRKVLDENLKDPESMMELEALKEENDKLRESEGYITSLLDKIEKLNHERTTWIGQSKELEKIKFEHKLLFQRYEELKQNKERELSNKFHEDLAKISKEKLKIEQEFKLLSQRYEELLTARLDSSRSSGLSQSFDEPDISFIFKIQEERDLALAANEDLQKTIEELNNNITSLQDRGNTLQKELRDTKGHLDKLMSMTEQEDLEISELQKLVEDKEKNIIELNKTIVVLEQSHIELIKEKEQMRLEVSEIQNLLVEKDSEISKLHRQHDVIVQRNIILSNEVEHHEREKILIERRAAQIELSARKAQSSTEELARKRDKQLQDEISRINETNSRLQKRIEELTQNCDDLMQVNEEQDKEIDELQNELANQRAMANRLRTEKEALHEDFESKLSLIADKYTEERQRIENEMKNLVESREQIENELKTDLSVKESQWQSKEEELNNKVKDLKETIQRLRGNKQDSKIILKSTYLPLLI